MLTFTRNLFGCFEGSHFQGEIVARYAELVNAFGPAGPGDDQKTDAEWDIEFSNDIRVTIYNWKDGKAYCGNGGLPLEAMYHWHIDGTDPQAVATVSEYLSRFKRRAA